MKALRLLTSIAVCFLWAQSLSAQFGNPISDPSGQLAAMGAANKEIVSIRCPFAMTRKVAMLAEPVKDDGVFRYCKEAGGFSLTSSSADGETLTMTREYFESKSGDKTVHLTASRNPAMRQMLDMIGGCLTGDFGALRTTGDVSYYDTPKRFTVVYTPKDKRTMRHVSSIVMIFDKVDYALAEMTLTTPNGDATTYAFGAKTYDDGCDL